MVASKYLCRAPHPDTWDERAEALLKSLGGNKAKRRAALRETLASLDTENLIRKIPRPGRKTNAEHAIAFYRYVLSLNEGDANGGTTDEETGTHHSESADEQGSVNRPRTPLEPSVSKARLSSSSSSRRSPRRDCVSKRRPQRGTAGGAVSSTTSTDNNADTASILSMDSEEFREQHNDLCEVCNGAGELICCSTCNLVFHLQCIRPPTTRLPPDKWCCAYCVAAGVRGHTKEARTRRRAAAAAREMTRMKNELQGAEKRFEKKGDKTGERKPPAKKRGRPRRGAISAAEEEEEEEDGAVQNQEPKAKKARTEEGRGANVEESETTPDGRARRERRPTNLYDPQAGAARTWQSDGAVEWKSLGNDQDTEDDTASKGTQDETDGSKTSGATEWCNFCHDDPAISVCCFCACRKCYGKHDKDKLLICDNCDAEYHIYCLDPPLKSVPPTKKWFCANCKNTKSDKKMAPAAAVKEKPKRRGRPPKKLSEGIESTSAPPAKRRGRPPKKLTRAVENTSAPPKRRGRPPGRPPKKSSSGNPAQPNTPVRSNVAKKRRGPGRPPKSSQPAQPSGEVDTQRATGGLNSVPASVFVPTSQSSHGMPSVNSYGNPGVNVMPQGLSRGSNHPPAEESVPQKSRSGRTVKRNPFHDEIYQGRQLMKTPARPSVSQYHQQHSAAAPKTSGSHGSSQAPLYHAYLQQQNKNVATNTPVLPQPGQPAAKAAGAAPMTQGATMPGITSIPGAPTSASGAAAMPTKAVAMPQPSHAATVMMTAQGPIPVPQASLAYPPSNTQMPPGSATGSAAKVPRRKPGARECMQMSRRFGIKVIPQNYMDTLLDYCSRGKVEHLIKMRERLDDHSRMLEAQLAGLEALVKEKGDLDITVPAAESTDTSPPM